MSGFSVRPISPAPHSRWLASFLVLAVTGGCAIPFGGPDPAETGIADPAEGRANANADEGSAGERFQHALDALGRQNLSLAHWHLRGLAARCDSGVWGREAVLMLASVELSPAFPEGSADTAARLAARYLQDTGVPPASALLAETLYLLAVDLGADPVGGPNDPPVEEGYTVAPRFEDCDDEPREPGWTRELPRHPGPRTTRTALDSVRSQRDSLAQQVDALTRRTTELEAEIERIRRLLLPDSAQGEGPPEEEDPGRSDGVGGGGSPDR